MEKLPGTYLNIRVHGGTYWIDYLDTIGDLNSIDLLYQSKPCMLDANNRELIKCQGQLKTVLNKKKLEEIRSTILWLQIAIKSSEIYAAYCKGLPVGDFFSDEKSKTNDQTKEAIKWCYSTFNERVRRKEKPTKQGIATEAMAMFFPDISRYQKASSKYGKGVLTPAWKKKRDSIRGSFLHKIQTKNRKRPVE